jgi:DNA-binding transcriptional MerR regulator
MGIDELADRAGVSVRTVRYYIGQGLLPGPGARGKQASYDEDHLARLRLIRRLAEQHVPLAEQRERLAQLSPDDLRQLLQEEERHARGMEKARAAASPRDYMTRLLARARARSPEPDRLAAPLQLEVDVASASATPLPQPEPTQHWELASGVDLYVRADAARRYAALIERLLEIARDESGRGSA